MGMRVVQVGILVVLVAIGGLLYSIRKQMTAQTALPPANPVASAPLTPAVQPGTDALTAQQPAPQPPVQVVVNPAPAVSLAPRRVEKPSAFSGSSAPAPRRTTSIPRRPAPSYESEAPVEEPTQATPVPSYASSAPVYSTPPPPPPAPAPVVRTITVPAGTAVAVRLLDHVSTERNRPGDTFQATLEEPIIVDGVVVADRGANVTGRVVHAQQSGRVAGLAEMALELDNIRTVAGPIQIASDTMIRQAEWSKGKDAATVGIMAGIGAAIGGIAGGRRGAGIGAASGGAAGAGTVAATRGRPVEFPPETRLTFRLRAPITVTVEGDRLRSSNSGMPEDPSRPRLQRRY